MPRREDVRKGDKLAKEFPQFADVVAHAGRQPSAAELAKFWTEQAAKEQRLADLKRAWRRTGRKRNFHGSEP
jgi:phage-related minor tail protein